MILDERAEFLDSNALNTGAAGTYLIGDVYDTGIAGTALQPNDPGTPDGLWFVAVMDVAATSGGLATLVVKLSSDAQPAIAVDGSATDHIVTAAIPVASLTVGRRIVVAKLPAGTYERYIGVLQVTGTAAFTAGQISAFLANDASRWLAYADAVN
jgi:hypothetical protein